MRRVLLQSKAFINGALCEAGSVVEIGDDTALAPYMTLMPAEPPPAAEQPAPAAAAPDKVVTVHSHPGSGEVDIEADGVDMHFDHATLKIETD